MFRRRKRTKPSFGHRAKTLRFESLEPRQLLAVDINTVASPGDLQLNGDFTGPGEADLGVELRSVNGSSTDFIIEAPPTTPLLLNGTPVVSPVTVTGITGDIDVDLGASTNSFSFVVRNNGQPSNAPADVNIENNGTNVNVVSDVLINGDLVVDEPGGGFFNDLSILRTTVIGDTSVTNNAGGSNTLIDSSDLQGGGALGGALAISNAAGDDIIQIQGASQFGAGVFPPGDVVVIANGAGASRTTFTGNSRTFGDVDITNGDNGPFTLDIVTFNGAEVMGTVTVANADGDTEVTVQDSQLGTDLVNGGPMIVRNDDGSDMFTMQDAEIFWGLWINHDDAQCRRRRDQLDPLVPRQQRSNPDQDVGRRPGCRDRQRE